MYAGTRMRVPPFGKRMARQGPAIGLRRRIAVWAVAGACAAQAFAADRQPQPWARLKLEALGFPGISSALLGVGASLLTVNFLDDSHLLVTFATRGLVPRVPGDPPEHDDRIVAAEIVDLPSGRIDAKTEWHLHDHGRYLWNLGGGRFLVRIGNEFSSMEPLANLGGGQPFRRIAFPRSGFRPGMVVVSPDRRVLTLETPVKLGKDAAQWGDVPESNRPSPTLVEFYRAQPAAVSDGGVHFEAAGRLLAPQTVALPVSADGTLWAVQKPHNGWAISFDTFNGKSMPAGELGSTCDPQLEMVSRSHYVAVTCMGGGDVNKIAAYGLDGHEAWEEPMSGLDAPVYALAPSAGRFAVLRTVEAVAAQPDASTGGSPERQELRVYQTESGDLLLKTLAAPSFKTAENFDLSEDGSLAVVIREGQIVVYKLDAPDKRDLADMKRAEKYAVPDAASGPLTFPRLTQAIDAKAVAPAAVTPAPAANTVAPATQAAADAAPAAAVASAPAAQQRPAMVAGDLTPVRHAPPTLLKPGEKPEFGKANPQPMAGGNDEDVAPPDGPQK